MPAMATRKKQPAKKKAAPRAAAIKKKAVPRSAAPKKKAAPEKAAPKKAAPKKKTATKTASPTPRPRKKREIYLEGHKRKFLVVVDETPECESALAFAASRAKRTKGQLALLYVIEPEGEALHWLGVEEMAREEGLGKAKAVFRLFSRKLRAMGFEELVPEEIVREGSKAEEITKAIEEDRDIGVLVLGASRDPSGPGPLVSSLAGGKFAGSFPVPITVVPGHLSTEEILALA
jgi:nucleotide-binding universal stress UspA family protein